MDDLTKELIDLERALWTGDADAYRRLLDDPCLVAFPGWAAVASREDVAGSVSDGPRWSEPDIEEVGTIRPGPDVAILTYRARAVHDGAPDEEPYRAVVSSAWARHDGGWKLVFHQQTPLTD